MKPLHHPDRESLTLSAVLYALSDPTRFHIVQMLASEGERACGTFNLPVAKPNMSYHIKVLREAGLIRQRGEGTQRINCLRRDDLDARFPGLLDTVLRAGSDAPTLQQTMVAAP
ncbi:MAG: helix-turn-helix transcriptional regulator [Chloroflexota bacterium]